MCAGWPQTPGEAEAAVASGWLSGISVSHAIASSKERKPSTFETPVVGAESEEFSVIKSFQRAQNGCPAIKG